MNAPRNSTYTPAPVIDNDLPARALQGVRTRRMVAILFDIILLILLTGLALFVLGVLELVTFGAAPGRWLRAFWRFFRSLPFCTTPSRCRAGGGRRRACT